MLESFLASFVLLLWAVRAGWRLDRKYQFALAVAFSVPVSYHLFVYDLAILLIPIMAALELALTHNSRAAQTAVLVPLLTVPIGLLWHPFLLAIPLLVFMAAGARAFRTHLDTLRRGVLREDLQYVSLDSTSAAIVNRA